MARTKTHSKTKVVDLRILGRLQKKEKLSKLIKFLMREEYIFDIKNEEKVEVLLPKFGRLASPN